MSRPADPLDFQLEPGSIGDVDAVAAIMAQAFDPRYGEAWTRSQCCGILPLNGVKLTLAWSVDRQALGFSLVRTVAGESELLLLAVRPEAQKCGIGRALIEHFVQLAQSDGATRLHLEVRDGNRAIDTYRKSGFAPIGRRSAYYAGRDGKQYDALTLARSL